jgi:ABC-2 type transport system ATP-binding protein
MACISINYMSKSFGKNQVLNNISVEVNDSEIFGILGPSGAGKTTLVKIIAGIDETTTDTVKVLNTSMPSLTIMQKIGYMAQSDALYAELNAYENLDFFASIYGLKGSYKKKRIQQVLEFVNLSDHIKKPIHSFSGGMKRRLSLAISVLHAPEILILDEPTVGIDPVLRQSIWEEFSHLTQNGTTIVLTTHVMDEADKCGRLGMIRDGKLIAVGSPSQLKENTNSATIEEAFLHFGGVKA